MPKYSNETLAKCVGRLNYDKDAGVFTWKERPRSDFSLEREWKRWNSLKPGKVAGSKQRTVRGTKSHLAISLNAVPFAAHRLAWLMHYGSIPDRHYIDHINGDPYDNRIANLRLCSNSQNQWNRLAPKNGTSGVKGVNWSKKAGKWKAACRVNGQFFHLGYHETKGMAALAVAKDSLRRHGSYSPFCRKMLV